MTTTPQWTAIDATNICCHITATGGGVEVEMVQEMSMTTSFGL